MELAAAVCLTLVNLVIAYIQYSYQAYGWAMLTAGCVGYGVAWILTELPE